MTYKPVWNMDSVFAGGSNSPQFYQKISSLEDGLKEFDDLVNSWNVEKDAPKFSRFETILTTREQIEKGIGEAVPVPCRHGDYCAAGGEPQQAGCG